MATPIENLQKFDFSSIVNNTDNNLANGAKITTPSTDTLDLIEITQTDDIDLMEKLLGDNFKENITKRNGLANKFVLYKPNSTNQNEDIYNDDKFDINKFNTIHAGLYYCDGKQNMYRLSPDYIFYRVVQKVLCDLDNRLKTLEGKNIDSRLTECENYIKELKQNNTEENSESKSAEDQTDTNNTVENSESKSAEDQTDTNNTVENSESKSAEDQTDTNNSE